MGGTKNLLRHAMERRFTIPESCAWVNYVRCHDDIGWAFSNDDVTANRLDPAAHRRFLTDFYTGKYPGSFARGLPFQEDPETGDARISGTCASLAGLDKAIEDKDEAEIELAIRRLMLIHGVIMTIGGIPVIYLGDELGTLNDYRYDQDVEKVGDSRWIHRPAFDWDKAAERSDAASISGRIYHGLLRLIQIRQQNLAFTRAETEIVDTGNKHVFGYFRSHDNYNVLVLANFSDQPQSLEARHLRMLGLRKTVVDLVAGKAITATRELNMAPYDFMVLVRPY